MQFATMPKQSSQTSRLTYTGGVKGGPPPPNFWNNKNKWVFNKRFKVYNSCLWWYPETSAFWKQDMRRGLGPSKGPRLRWEELLGGTEENIVSQRGGHWFVLRENQWYYTCLAPQTFDCFGPPWSDTKHDGYSILCFVGSPRSFFTMRSIRDISTLHVFSFTKKTL